jgi:hypothetical protein
LELKVFIAWFELHDLGIRRDASAHEGIENGATVHAHGSWMEAMQAAPPQPG